MTRYEYLRALISTETTVRKEAHRKYFSQFVDDELINNVKKRIGSLIMMSTDAQHFNDIPVEHWEAMEHLTLKKHHEFKKVGDFHTPLNSILVLKEAARQIFNGR